MATWPILATRYAQDAPVSTDLFSDIIAQITSNTANLNSPQTSIGIANIVNGSFEIDPNNTVQPTGWTFTAGTGGAGLTTNADQNDGAFSYKMTQDTTGGHTAGTLQSIDNATGLGKLPVSPGQLSSTVQYGGMAYEIVFSLKCDRTDIQNKVTINWYDSAKIALSTTIVYDVTNTPPTVWTKFAFLITPPNGAYFMTVTLAGGQNTVTPPASTAHIFWDDISIKPRTPMQTAIGVSSQSTATFFIPNGVFLANVKMFGKASGANFGGYIEGNVRVKPGDQITITNVSGDGQSSTLVIAGNTFTCQNGSSISKNSFMGGQTGPSGAFGITGGSTCQSISEQIVTY